MRRRSFNLRRTFSALARRLRPPCTMNAAMASSTRSLDLPSRQVGMANSHREEIRSHRAALHGMACMVPFWRCVHLSTWPPTGAKLLRPGSVRAVAAESLLREQQLLIGNRSRPGDAGQVRRGVGGSVELVAVIADMKRRNPRFSCVRIAQQTSDVWGANCYLVAQPPWSSNGCTLRSRRYACWACAISRRCSFTSSAPLCVC